MQCVACGSFYSDSQEICPHCPTTNDAPADDDIASLPPEEKSMSTSTSQERKTAKTASGATNAAKAGATATAGDTSRLIEFPGVPPKPQWRKELSERVREIQQRRALEAARDTEASAPSQDGYLSIDEISDATAAAADPSAHPLGLVPPPPEAPQPNPLVVAALKRIERARQSNPPPPLPRAW